MSEQVRIWSDEHGCWWRPDGNGYTNNMDEAWVLDRDQAVAATWGCGPEKHIQLLPALPGDTPLRAMTAERDALCAQVERYSQQAAGALFLLARAREQAATAEAVEAHLSRMAGEFERQLSEVNVGLSTRAGLDDLKMAITLIRRGVKAAERETWEKGETQQEWIDKARQFLSYIRLAKEIKEGGDE